MTVTLPLVPLEDPDKTNVYPGPTKAEAETLVNAVAELIAAAKLVRYVAEPLAPILKYLSVLLLSNKEADSTPTKSTLLIVNSCFEQLGL